MSALPPSSDSGPQTLATANLPRRVRRVLEHLLHATSDELERHLSETLSDFEQQLFRLSEHARSSRSNFRRAAGSFAIFPSSCTVPPATATAAVTASA